MQDIGLFLQHHWALSVALIIVLFLSMIVEFMNQKRSILQLSPAKATQLINRDNAIVVDLRSNALFAEGHIIGAISIPQNEIEQKWKKIEKLRAQPLILVCASGTESPKAAMLFTKQGFNVRILAGGMRAWREAEMPSVKE